MDFSVIFYLCEECDLNFGWDFCDSVSEFLLQVNFYNINSTNLSIF